MTKNTDIDMLEFNRVSKFKRIQRAINCSRMNSSYEFCDNCDKFSFCKIDKHLKSRLKEIKLL